MAERRMITKKVTDDDNFMSLSSSAQALYLHLNMSADDDGFNNQVNLSMFKAHASIDDLQSLLERRYIYQFSNGVIVIKHWRMANALRKDRYTPTNFQEELKQLGLKDNGSYTWLPNGCQMVATGKDRLDKVSIDKNSKFGESKRFQKPSLEELIDYIKSNNYQVDPQRFMDYYESNGWKVGGKAPMKNWQACVRTWNSKEKPKAKYDETEMKVEEANIEDLKRRMFSK